MDYRRFFTISRAIGCLFLSDRCPDRARSIVRRWIEDRQTDGGGIEATLNAVFIEGGPGGCSYLDADGEVWDWSVWDESITRVEDGPLKVGLIAGPGGRASPRIGGVVAAPSFRGGELPGLCWERLAAAAVAQGAMSSMRRTGLAVARTE